MTCDTAHKRLNALLDEECNADEATLILAHLEVCSQCAEEYAQLAAIRRTADVWKVEGGEVWSAVREQIALPDLGPVMEELHQLRAEVRALHAEIAMLRSRGSDKESPILRSPSPLLPYTPSTARELNIV